LAGICNLTVFGRHQISFSARIGNLLTSDRW